jgi:G:T/U-mismatch repair DNA glycosylase
MISSDPSGKPVGDLARGGGVIETHPLEPFLPADATILFLGSFPPPRERWSMEFFYPNFRNDFWRIQGLIHFGDPKYFEDRPEDGSKPVRFDRERIIAFCREKGLAFYDTARKICRLKGNASDAFLEILESADLPDMLARMPDCRTLVTTGGKSSEELQAILARQGTQTHIPAPGTYVDTVCGERPVRWWRMPSSSRAYPLSIAGKTKAYSLLWEQDAPTRV